MYGELLRTGGEKRKALSARTVSHTHVVLHKALKDAVRRQRLTRNPADAVDPPKVKAGAHEMKTWDAKQVKAFLDSTGDDRLGGLWRLMASTGLRRGEACGLRWQDVDIEGGRLSVRRALIVVGTEIVVSEPKTARGRRTVSFDPATIAALKSQAARQGDDGQRHGEAWVDSGLVFTQETGESLHPDRVSDAFRDAVVAAGLPLIRLHDLRHTHASLGLAAGIPAKVMSERLGHSTVSITLDTYSHVLPGMQEDAGLKIAALFT